MCLELFLYIPRAVSTDLLQSFVAMSRVTDYSAGSQHRPASVVCGDEQSDRLFRGPTWETESSPRMSSDVG